MSNETASDSVKPQQLAESLVERISSGDRSAEEQLVMHYRRGLYLILRKECGDPDLAEDLTQDTLEKVIMNARDGKIRKPRALAGYIRQLGIYQLIDLRRKEKRRKTKPSADISEYIAADNTSLIDAVDSDQAGELLRELITELPMARDREMLRRFYLVGQDKSVIANELGVTPAHFDRVKSRALLRMRKLVLGHLKSHGAARADLLSIIFIVTLVSGEWVVPTVESVADCTLPYQDGTLASMVRESAARPHYTGCALGFVYPLHSPVQKEVTA
ncbi:MAG: sigma-70 family RNA polymerase sigma factor [Gammaproteobacteria bacterium]|nr:sigma-70 family RNA polymerase sigma factor [Gammaproteobacteria bacterium]